MRVSAIVAGFILVVGCQSESTEQSAAQPPTGTAAKTQSTLLAPESQLEAVTSSAGSEAEAANADSSAHESTPAPATESAATTAVNVTFHAGDSDSPLAPRYSPPGRGLPLKAVEVAPELGLDGLETEVVLGAPADGQSPIRMLITRAAADQPYTRLFVDTDRNGQFNEEPVIIDTTESRGNIWSSFSATLPVNYAGNENITEEYPVSFWATVEKAADRPEVLRISRRGFKVGEISLDEKTVSVILSDSNNDAIFGEGDWWELRNDDNPPQGINMRKVGEFFWLGDSAYKLELDGATGRTGRIAPFDPGMTREEDELARDPFGADRKAVRADIPLEFRHDAEIAIAEAAEKQMPCFIKFETEWCGPCKTMTQLVFTAKDVVDAAEGVISVKVDGDEHKDLVERYSVGAYPTGVMLSADGTEATRFVGYQNVREMSDFLRSKRSAAEPAATTETPAGGVPARRDQQ